MLAEDTYGSLDKIFTANQKKFSNSSYGAQQSIMQHRYYVVSSDGKQVPAYFRNVDQRLQMPKVTTPEFDEMVEYLQDKYKFSYKDAKELLFKVDTSGICTNAAGVNILVNWELKNSNLGESIDLNHKLIDWYINGNEGGIVITMPDGTKKFDSNATEKSFMVVDENTGKVTIDLEGMNKAIQGQGIKGEYNISGEFLLAPDNVQQVADSVKIAMEKDKTVNLIVSRQEINGKTQPLHFKIYDEDGVVMPVNGGHVVTVTGQNEYGFVVDQDGKKGFVTYSDMLNCGGFVNIEVMDIVN